MMPTLTKFGPPRLHVAAIISANLVRISAHLAPDLDARLPLLRARVLQRGAHRGFIKVAKRSVFDDRPLHASECGRAHRRGSGRAHRRGRRRGRVRGRGRRCGRGR
eukprot:2516911-Pleurochrysis_carterae.AAC.1